MIPDRLLRILRTCETPETNRFPPTEIFNEGWMLRLVLDAAQTVGLHDHPLQFLDQARWYSEALLSSPFRPRSRADKLAEGFTNADGVIGHFAFNSSTQSGLRLHSDAKQFTVVEAKMFSNLSPGTTNARIYDQAARNVACMAEAISQSGKNVGDFDKIGFFVIAPALEKRKHRNSNLETCTDHLSIRRNLTQRINAYEEASRSEAPALRKWEAEFFLPLIERLVATNSLGVLSWEDCIASIGKADQTAGKELESFYSRCLDYDPSPAR